jgi:hypothetical protein
MLNERLGTGAMPPPGFFALLTAQAWLDPELARSLGSDRNAAVARFAGEEGLELPAIDAIEAFILPDNPVGRAEPLDQVQPLYASAESCGCFTDKCTAGCTVGCPTAAASCAGCPTGPTGCCWFPTMDCSADCPTVACTVGFCAP